MRSGCFGCDAVIEGDTVEAVADGFIAHVAASHQWSYPEAALRNYARNYAEASERLTGATERLDTIGTIAIHPVTADRVDDWLDFFDHLGFAGNPDWASCYCRENHDPPTDAEPERHWKDNRADMADRLRTGNAFGYLAYVDGHPAGWVNASRGVDYAIHRLLDPDGPERSSVIAVSCFVIAPPFRRHGVAAALLDRVIADAPGRGAKWVEGFPHNVPEEGDPGHFRGPRSMYAARGFTAAGVRESDTVMRRPVE